MLQENGFDASVMVKVSEGFGLASNNFKVTTSPDTDALLELVAPEISVTAVIEDAANFGAPPPRLTPPELVLSRSAGTYGSVPVWSPVVLVVEVDATLDELEVLEVLEVVDDEVVDELPLVDPVLEALFVPEDPVPLAPELDPDDEDWEFAPLDDEFPDADPELPEAPDADPLFPALPASPWLPPESPELELPPVSVGPSPPADTV